MLRNFVFVKHKLHIANNMIGRRLSSLVLSKGLIDNCWMDSSDKKTFQVLNPANGAEIGVVPDMTTDDAQKAICAAKEAFHCKDWTGLTAKQRSDLLMKWFTLIEKNRTEIGKIMTSECGKPIKESLGELAYGNGFVEWFAAEARRIYGEIIPSPAANRELMVIKQPMGVAVMITPWNFPLAMVTRKVAAAFAAGCTVVLKPAPETPLTALALGKLAVEAGFPKGTLNIITTLRAPPVGQLFCQSPDVATISFTGSTMVGKVLYKDCAGTMKRVSLELGGNAPFIVFDSANVQVATKSAIGSKFRNCGQACISANRFFVQEKIYDAFLKELQEQVSKLTVGCGDREDVLVGPLINKSQFQRVENFAKDAKEKNGKIIQGGKACTTIGELFFEPTIITNVTPEMNLYRNEIFGPIVAVSKFKTEEEVLQKANDTRSGLAGYIFSEDVQQIFRVARKLEVGMVGINEAMISTPEAPFGGVKESGIGREGSYYGIDEYVNVKYICLGNMKY